MKLELKEFQTIRILKVFENNLFDTPLIPESQTTLKSNLKLYLNKGDKNLTTGIEVYENLGIKHSDRYQYTLPYYDFIKIFLR